MCDFPWVFILFFSRTDFARRSRFWVFSFLLFSLPCRLVYRAGAKVHTIQVFRLVPLSTRVLQQHSPFRVSRAGVSLQQFCLLRTYAQSVQECGHRPVSVNGAGNNECHFLLPGVPASSCSQYCASKPPAEPAFLFSHVIFGFCQV